MAIYVDGKTKCLICGKVIESSVNAVAFPPFVPEGHEFSRYSDGVFHTCCFQSWDDHERFQRLYDKYKEVWNSRPSNLSFAEIEEWGKRAFKDVFGNGMVY